MRSVTTAMNSCPPSAGGRILPVRAPFNACSKLLTALRGPIPNATVHLFDTIKHGSICASRCLGMVAFS